eukprot:snap_masked-scaffold_14-processed-gene-3.58-mRNA-1 protein AED:1.00 eAED:1.00 QI:0/0/0/0/1/1/3/0/95
MLTYCYQQCARIFLEQLTPLLTIHIFDLLEILKEIDPRNRNFFPVSQSTKEVRFFFFHKIKKYAFATIFQANIVYFLSDELLTVMSKLRNTFMFI